MHDIYKPSKEAAKIIAHSKEREHQVMYYQLLEGAFEDATFAAKVAKMDEDILVETRIKAALEDMRNERRYGATDIAIIPYQLSIDQNPHYIAPALSVQTNRSIQKGLVTYESRIIRARRNTHEGLWGVEISGQEGLGPAYMCFYRMEEPGHRILELLGSITPKKNVVTQEVSSIRRALTFWTPRYSSKE